MADGAPNARTQKADTGEADRLKARSWDLNWQILVMQRELAAVNDRIHELQGTQQVGTIRDLSALHPEFRHTASLWLANVKRRGIDLLVTETLRSWEVMEAYYARGRQPLETVNALYVKAGLRPITLKENDAKITNAQPGLSWHAYGLAIDFVPMLNGVADWKYDPADPADHYDEIAEEAQKLGAIWGGTFRTRPDAPHIEYHPHHDGHLGITQALAEYQQRLASGVPMPQYISQP